MPYQYMTAHAFSRASLISPHNSAHHLAAKILTKENPLGTEVDVLDVKAKTYQVNRTSQPSFMG